MEKHLEKSFSAPYFQRDHGELYITEKLIKCRRKVLQLFFPANLVSMFLALTREQIKRKFKNLTRFY